jgi:cyanobactin cluster PatC/TenC/TruC protein
LVQLQKRVDPPLNSLKKEEINKKELILIMATEKKPEATPKTSGDHPPKKKLVKYKFKQDTLTTGLSDYGFWTQQVKEERAKLPEIDPPFRRGRIW